MTDGSLVNIQILDTAGQERFKAINTSYYREADCCLLVYDISERKSFDDIKNYFLEKIKDNCKENIQIILLGNKTDLEHLRQIKPEEGANLAGENNFIFMETSCLKNSNVSDAFETLIELTNREMMKNKNNKKDPGNIVIDASHNKKKEGKKICSCL